jgi:cephalosporin hydroxylase
MSGSEQAPMKINQIDKQSQKPELWKSIPSIWFDFQEIYDEAVATAPPGSLLVEVGSFWGQSAVYLAEAAKIADKGLKVYCVDLFNMRPENNPPLFNASVNPGLEPPIHAKFHQSQFETFAHFVDATRLSPDPLRMMRIESLEAAKFFSGVPDIHFLYLDGDHEYDYVAAELKAWFPLMRENGIIAGHDYTEEFDGVRRAVTEFFGPNGCRRVVRVECGRSWIVRII